jgi:hypothetical protein
MVFAFSARFRGGFGDDLANWAMVCRAIARLKIADSHHLPPSAPIWDAQLASVANWQISE